jgi:hypothetical protein
MGGAVISKIKSPLLVVTISEEPVSNLNSVIGPDKSLSMNCTLVRQGGAD